MYWRIYLTQSKDEMHYLKFIKELENYTKVEILDRNLKN